MSLKNPIRCAKYARKFTIFLDAMQAKTKTVGKLISDGVARVVPPILLPNHRGGLLIGFLLEI